ncbi:alpha/beta fold hydrolase [Sphingomonas xinjiangensis]|uniref:Pimeloyl-ACP methyl ester carboxylesterase n=1 Tax=Sphingomonas xinjiangensis TaxID=643568 RepID=A0A840YH18_9SPHN|nr:alpha/beta hydrolase [Sphingomonas xinjiangensis]MBB5711615.1 pimeloyl-ACP methyl ester carboxylesterase [Sphingomonas xinjiangensis]
MRARTMLAAIGIALSSASMASAQSASPPPATVESDRISVTVEGTGPDVILIPGLASSREVWAGLAARLRQGHRLHLVQVAGFAGLPAVPDPDGRVAAPTTEAIANYIRRERLTAPTIIGHSLGGEVALMLGARYPDRVGRLLIVDALPFYSLLIDPAATSDSVKPQAAVFRNAMLAAPATQAEAMQSASIARLAKTEAVRPALIAAGIRSDRKTVIDATYELMTTDLRPELGRITAPVEVVYAYDPIYGVPASNIDATFRNAYASTPHVSFKRIDGSFHFVMLDQPEAFARVVIDFLGDGVTATTNR